MFTPPLPKTWLIHSITYDKPSGKDAWGKKTTTPVYINNVRFDDGTRFTRNNTQNQILANAVIFVCATHSTNLPDKFEEDATLQFNGKTYTIKNIVDAYYPDKNAIRHWELEVV